MACACCIKCWQGRSNEGRVASGKGCGRLKPLGFLQVEGPETDLPLACIYGRNPKLACTPGTIPQEHAQKNCALQNLVSSITSKPARDAVFSSKSQETAVESFFYGTCLLPIIFPRDISARNRKISGQDTAQPALSRLVPPCDPVDTGQSFCTKICRPLLPSCQLPTFHDASVPLISELCLSLKKKKKGKKSWRFIFYPVGIVQVVESQSAVVAAGWTLVTTFVCLRFTPEPALEEHQPSKLK